MKDWQRVICVIIFILIIIMVILIINNFKREERMFNSIENIYLEGTSFQNISIPYKKLKEKNYNFKVVNYKDKKIVNKDIFYNISVNTSKNIKIKLFKDNNEVELKDNSSPNYILNSKILTEDNFKFKIIKSKINKEDYVNIKIKSWIKKEN